MRTYSENDLIEAASEFRNHSRTINQFLRCDDINRTNICVQDLTREGDTEILYQNMILLGFHDDIRIYEGFIYQLPENGFKRSETHHIIPIELKNEFPIIKIDDGRNGIILPFKGNYKVNFSVGVVHHGNHTDGYKNEIRKRLHNITHVEDIWRILDSIKLDLFYHKLFVHNTNDYN